MIQGHRLREAREQRVLSQGALGKLVAKDGAYISKIERGVLVSVSTTTLERLVAALEVSADYLLGAPRAADTDHTPEAEAALQGAEGGAPGDPCTSPSSTTQGQRHERDAAGRASDQPRARSVPGGFVRIAS